MKIKHIKFKITTNKILKCNKCKTLLKDKKEEGFVQIYIGQSGWSYYNDIKLNICWDCFTEFKEECKEDRNYRKANYNKAMKKAILRNLK